jgi:hypothetical protein
MAYNYLSAPSPNYTPDTQTQAVYGRPRTITHIAIHWWGDPNTNPSFEGVVSVLRNPARQASSHYVATGTGRRVAHLVEERHTSWATNSANPFTISIECDPRCRNEDYDVVAELIANIRKRHGNLPLVPHRQYSATQCPGNYDLARLDREARAKTTVPVPKATKLVKAVNYLTKAGATLVQIKDQKVVKTFKADEVFTAYASIVYSGKTYYISQYSYEKGIQNGVVSSSVYTPAPVVVPPSIPAYEKNLVKFPSDKRAWITNSDAKLHDIITGKQIAGVYTQGQLIDQIAGETRYNGNLYFITRYSLDRKIWKGFLAKDLSTTPPPAPQPPKDDPTDPDVVEGGDRFTSINQEDRNAIIAFLLGIVEQITAFIGKLRR